MSGEAPPPAYDEWEPYSFVTYSHFDAALVYPEIRWLQSHGHQIYYDEGIRPGSVWHDDIAKRIERCERLIYFVSPHAVESEHCTREVRFALDEGRPVIAVYLQETRLPAGMRLSLSHRQAIMKHQFDAATYRRKLAAVMSDARPAREPAPMPPVHGASHFRVSARVARFATDPVASRLADSVARYISWQGGVFQAQTSDAADPDYVVTLDASSRGSEIEVRWEVGHVPSGDIAGSSQLEHDASATATELKRITATVGAAVLTSIVNRENRLSAGLPTEALSFRQLMLRADRPYYLDPEDLAVRAKDLARARLLQPNSALPHASAASLTAWRIRNGASTEPTEEADQARNDARAALRLEGHDPAVLQRVGMTYARLRDPVGALSLLRRAHAMAPTLEAKDQLARCLSFNGEPEAALAMFDEVLDTMPEEYPFPHIRLAMTQIQLGQLEAALESTRTFTVQFPDDHYGWFVLANLLEQLGDATGAQSALNRGQANPAAPPLQNVIDGTLALWGHSEAQRHWLAAGWQSLKKRLDDRS